MALIYIIIQEERTMQQQQQQQLQRLQWACRRGMLELDILLQRYLAQGYPQALPLEQQRFEQLLACTDQDLFDWLLQKRAADPEHAEMVAKILNVGDNA